MVQGDEASALHLVSLLLAKDVSNHACQCHAPLCRLMALFHVRLRDALRSKRSSTQIKAASSRRLHAKPRFYASSLQRLRFPAIHRPLLRLLLRRQRPYLVLLFGELCASRRVFAVEVHGRADSDVLASYGHDAGELDVVDEPAGIGWGGYVGVAGGDALVAFGEDEVSCGVVG